MCCFLSTPGISQARPTGVGPAAGAFSLSHEVNNVIYRNPKFMSISKFLEPDDGPLLQLPLNRVQARMLLTVVRTIFGNAIEDEKELRSNNRTRERTEKEKAGLPLRTRLIREQLGPVEQFLADYVGTETMTARVNGDWIISPRYIQYREQQRQKERETATRSTPRSSPTGKRVQTGSRLAIRASSVQG